MKFRCPGWGIGWFTPLLVFGAPIVAYGSFVEGSTGFAIFWISVAVFAALTWFQQRWAAIPLIGYFCLALTGIAIAFATEGSSVSLFAKLLATLSGIYELIVWARSPHPEDSFGDLDFDQFDSNRGSEGDR